MDGIETVWINPALKDQPLVVFLHEGLGSVALWRDFPQTFCNQLHLRGLVFSRFGYGQSTPRKPNEHWQADFMHLQAQEFLPAYLASLGIDTKCNPPLLFGHSDGASIALIYAASFPMQTCGVMALAPHIMIENITIENIRQSRVAYETPATQLKAKLSKYHGDVDSAFYGWCDVWLSEAFQAFDIKAMLPKITCPVLAIQGKNDNYGTMAQIEQIAEAVPQTQLFKLQGCGHSPHVDQPLQVITKSQEWLSLCGV